MEQVHRGWLIAIEGIDGAGKTTIARALASRLQILGYDALFVSRSVLPADLSARSRLQALSRLLWEYPDGSAVQEFGDRHLILLMASWFALFDLSVLRSLLRRGCVLITDQTPTKYIARFHAKGVRDVAQLFDRLTPPDLVLHLDVPPEVAAARKEILRVTECNSVDVSAAAFCIFQRKVSEELSKLRYGTWRTLDASEPFERVLDSVTTLVMAANGPAPIAHYALT